MPRFVSLDELPAELENRFSVAWQFTSSSSFDDHALELNERHTRHTLQAYGFGGLVVQSYFGEGTTYDTDGVSVSDLNPDGSTTGSAAISVAHAERASVSVQYERRRSFSFSEWPIATVRINRTELADRVANRVQAGGNERRAQTTELDAALRLGLWKAGLQKAKSDLNPAVDFTAALFSSNVISDLLSHDAFGLGVDLAGSQVTSLVLAGAGKVLFGVNRSLRDKRFSIFPGNLQPDRLLLGAGMTALRFIRYNRKKEQPKPEW